MVDKMIQSHEMPADEVAAGQVMMDKAGQVMPDPAVEMLLQPMKLPQVDKAGQAMPDPAVSPIAKWCLCDNAEVL
jgi:hypothetical protein